MEILENLFIQVVTAKILIRILPKSREESPCSVAIAIRSINLYTCLGEDATKIVERITRSIRGSMQFAKLCESINELEGILGRNNIGS